GSSLIRTDIETNAQKTPKARPALIGHEQGAKGDQGSIDVARINRRAVGNQGVRHRRSAIVGERWIKHEVDVDGAAAIVSDLVAVDAIGKATAGCRVADEIIERGWRLGRSHIDATDDVAGSRSASAGEVAGDDGVIHRHRRRAEVILGGRIQATGGSVNNPIAGDGAITNQYGLARCDSA